MDSAIDISSSSDEDEVSPTPVREDTRTRRNPSWLDGRMNYRRISSSARAQSGQTSNASRNGASSSGVTKQSTGNANSRLSNASGHTSNASRTGGYTLLSGDSTWNANVVKSGLSYAPGVDNEKLSPEKALKRTLPASFNLPSTSRSRDSKQFTRNANVVNSRASGVDIEQARKRILPPSYLPSRNANGLTSGNGSRFGADYRSPAVLGDNKSNFGDRYGGAHAEIGIHRGISGPRILPPSLMHGASTSPMHYSGTSVPMHRSGVGEERNAENSERLIYQAALQDMNQPKNEIDLLPGTLSVPLMRHQKIALAWMFQKEITRLPCAGGILADDQGLGKTVSTIALILKQKFESQLMSENASKQEAEALVLDDDDESENTKHENISNVISELKASNSSESSVLNAGGNDENGSSNMEKSKGKKVSTSTHAFKSKRPAAGTLIVCPASVVRQWERELDEKVSDECKLSVLVYHGGNRTKDAIELAKYDVVVTTYAIVSSEVPKQPLVDDDERDEKNTEKHGLASGVSNNKKRKFGEGASKKSKKKGKKCIDDSSFEPECRTLARVVWFRVVLDEAQTIKNHRTQVARSCYTLRAKWRWCLSGTPIQNTIDDLFSYFRFLKYDPYAVYKSFCSTLKFPISKNSLHGYKKLQAVLKAVMLRRTKGTLLDGQPIINIPPKKVNLSKVDFTVEERSFYRKLEAASQEQFKAYAAAGTLRQNYANILLMLLRLRQACDHPQLVKGYNSDPVGKESEEAVKRLPREARINLLKRLESSAICCECDDPPEDPVVTLCGHVFCYQCVSEYITGDENMCPVRKCREELGRDVVFSKSALKNCTTDDISCSSSQDIGKSAFLKGEFCSSKIKAVLDILHSLSKQSSPDDDVTIIEPMSPHSSSPRQEPIKTIVFSQWTGMLDLVEMWFDENLIEFRRLDGTMSLGARDRAVKEFSNDPDVKVMLMSLKAGNLGLNMVAACHVILLDLWWNPTTEDQAIDRAHRIGQTRQVTVTRITIKDTVEDRILELQEKKREVVASAFGEDHGGTSATRLTVDDLKYLFKV